MIGIYKIFNTITKKLYIGSSENIKQRWQKHKALLRYNKHDNYYLQNAWNKYGEDSFEFSIIEECSLSDLLNKEQYYLDTLLFSKTFLEDGGKLFYSLGYNLNPICNRPFFTNETRNKISETLKSKYCNNIISKTHTKKCYQYNRFTGELIKIWDVVNDANRHYLTPNNKNSKIHRCLWKESISAYDSVWSYETLTFIWATKPSRKGFPIVVIDLVESTYGFYSTISEFLRACKIDVNNAGYVSQCIQNNKLFKKRYEIIYLEAPIIYDRKPFELLGLREDLVTKTSEEILNGTVKEN